MKDDLPSAIDPTDDGEPRHCECPAAGSYVGPPLPDGFYAEEELPPQLDGAAPVFAIERKRRYLKRLSRKVYFNNHPSTTREELQ